VAAGLALFRAFRDDLRSARGPLLTIQDALLQTGFDVSLVRLLEILVWITVEPNGHYRRDGG
jgi:hypothetical protein